MSMLGAIRDENPANVRSYLDEHPEEVNEIRTNEGGRKFTYLNEAEGVLSAYTGRPSPFAVKIRDILIEKGAKTYSQLSAPATSQGAAGGAGSAPVSTGRRPALWGIFTGLAPPPKIEGTGYYAMNLDPRHRDMKDAIVRGDSEAVKAWFREYGTNLSSREWKMMKTFANDQINMPQPGSNINSATRVSRLIKMRMPSTGEPVPLPERKVKVYTKSKLRGGRVASKKTRRRRHGKGRR